jgi:ribosomal protein L4
MEGKREGGREGGRWGGGWNAKKAGTSDGKKAEATQRSEQQGWQQGGAGVQRIVGNIPPCSPQCEKHVICYSPSPTHSLPPSCPPLPLP